MDVDPKLSAEITALESQLAMLTTRVRSNEAARKALRTTLQTATRAAEAPIEALWALILAPHTPAALMALLDMGAIDAIATAPVGITAAALASACNADETLVARLLRPLSAAGIVAETAERTYAPTPLTKLLMAPPMRSGFTYMFATATPALASLPHFLRATHYANPTAAPPAAPTPFMTALGTPAPHFAYLEAHPDLHAHFNAFMAAKQAKRSTWLAALPVESLVHADFRAHDPSAVLLVDMGGGAGHDIAAFARAFPGPGRLVLQDLPAVVRAIGADALPARVERMAVDLFAPQCVRGARAYYMRSVLHNHGDARAAALLRRVADAMAPGYSRLLLAELVLPARGAGAWGAAHDVNMLALLGGAERSEGEFRHLLGAAGLRLVGVHWDPIGDSEAVIEAVLEGDADADVDAQTQAQGANGHAM